MCVEREISVLLHYSFTSADNDDGGREGGPEELRTATVDIKRLALFLTGEQLEPAKVICSKLGFYFRKIQYNNSVALSVGEREREVCPSLYEKKQQCGVLYLYNLFE